ncbi:MAG: 16S rRNA (guanine(527)-N(7))-methyltransferase RsmG [Anaerolineae bacterium]|nr:16S rRNA (guanine(527)-N(7))-methyltransferase RsmG [Anaerolineae bacterium]
MSTLTQSAADLFGVQLTSHQVDQFTAFNRELAAWNTHTNLTAITEPDEVRVKHFLDSLSVVCAAPMMPGMRVIDVGTGAGFPGLPLKIAYPDIHLTLLEATGKKVTFLDHVVTVLGLDHVTTLHARAEEAGHMNGQRGAYDLVLARAVTRLPALVEYLLPLAKLGGRCIAMKGHTAHAEIKDSQRALSIIGGHVTAVETVELPGIEEPHYLVVIEKTAHTPSAYPRKPGIPSRKPLA